MQSVFPETKFNNARTSTSSATKSMQTLPMSNNPPAEKGQSHLKVTKTAFPEHALVLVCIYLNIHDDAHSDLVIGLQKENESTLTNNQGTAKTASYGEKEETASVTRNGNKSPSSERDLSFFFIKELCQAYIVTISSVISYHHHVRH